MTGKTYEAWFDAKQADGTYWHGIRKFIYMKAAENWLKQVIHRNAKYADSKDRVSGINQID